MATPTTLALRDYQSEALSSIHQAESGGMIRPLVVIPTGTGKTVVFSHLINERPSRSLVLVHRDELIRQTISKLHMVNPLLDIGVIKAEENEVDAKIVVASVQTLWRPNRLTQVKPDFGLVVVDEAHHATAQTYQAILDYMGCLDEDDGTFTVGFTATPSRGDGTLLAHVWQEIIYSQPILSMIRRGYLADLRGKRIRLDINLDEVKQSHGDFGDEALAEAMSDANAPEHIAQAYLRYADGRKTIGFTPTVAFAHETAAAFRDVRLRAEVISALTPLDERRRLLREFADGSLRIILNCGVLTEGFDEPSVDCIMVARPTRSRPLYTQMVGRGTRRYPGKADCLILDFAGASRFPLTTLAQLMELPEDALESGTVLEAAERVTRLLAHEQEAEERRAGQIVADDVNLFGAGSEMMRWLPGVQAGSFIVSVPNGFMRLIRRNDGLYQVGLHRRDREVELLGDMITLEYAQGVAEDRIRNSGWDRLTSPSAPWRSRPASEKQRVTLAKFGVVVNLTTSAGDASDLISQAIAQMQSKGRPRQRVS